MARAPVGEIVKPTRLSPQADDAVRECMGIKGYRRRCVRPVCRTRDWSGSAANPASGGMLCGLGKWSGNGSVTTWVRGGPGQSEKVGTGGGEFSMVFYWRAEHLAESHTRVGTWRYRRSTKQPRAGDAGTVLAAEPNSSSVLAHVTASGQNSRTSWCEQGRRAGRDTEDGSKLFGLPRRRCRRFTAYHTSAVARARHLRRLFHIVNNA